MNYIYRNRAVAAVFAVALGFASFTSLARAEVIFVSGEVSGVWTADSVIVADSISVPAGDTLTIMPGVMILVTSYYKFEILENAVLHAVGTETDSISLLPFTEGDRTLGIDFINASDQSIMEYWYISDALTSGIHAENSDITIRNCLIEESKAPSGVEGGGAIELLNGSDALIENCILRNNESTSEGGAIYCEQSSPIIRGNLIEDNFAGYSLGAYGGAIACENSSDAQVLDNIIMNNSARPIGSFSIGSGAGGAIFCAGGSDAVIAGNLIAGNWVNSEPQTTSDGGAMFITNSDPVISNNIIAGNEARGNDGGAFYLSGSGAMFLNNTIVNNEAGDLGGAIYMYVSHPVIINSILYFNQDSAGTQIYGGSFSNATVSYSDIEGSWQGTGNLDIDPLIRNPQAGDYHLMATDCGDPHDSPCIDVGSPDYTDSLLDCSWGLGIELSDMGAYGGGEMTPTSIDYTAELPGEFFALSNYPNPFNAKTTIIYSLLEAAKINLKIYDMLGRKVETLVENRTYSAGEHTIIWNASRLASGIYYYRIETNERSQINRMLLIK
jgi:hypothetical protein